MCLFFDGRWTARWKPRQREEKQKEELDDNVQQNNYDLIKIAMYTYLKWIVEGERKWYV